MIFIIDCFCIPSADSTKAQNGTRWLTIAIAYDVSVRLDHALSQSTAKHFSSCRGSKLLPSFVKYLDTSDADAEETKANLYKEFEGLEAHLKTEGPFLKGSNVSAGDLALAPRLYHSSVALRHFKASLTCFLLALLIGQQSWFPPRLMQHLAYSHDGDIAIMHLPSVMRGSIQAEIAHYTTARSKDGCPHSECRILTFLLISQ